MSDDKLTLLPDDLSALEVIASCKGGALRRRGKQILFNTDGDLQARVYDESLLDFLLDWGRTPHVVSAEQQALLTAAGRNNNIPVRCVTRSGRTYDYCELQFVAHPPPASWFIDRRIRWYYVSELASLTPSPQAVPVSIMARLKKVQQHNKHILGQIQKLKGNLLENAHYPGLVAQMQMVVVRDSAGKLYKFDELDSPLIRDYSVAAAEFTLVEQPSAADLHAARDLSDRDYNERGMVSEMPVVLLADIRVFEK